MIMAVLFRFQFLQPNTIWNRSIPRSFPNRTRDRNRPVTSERNHSIPFPLVLEPNTSLEDYGSTRVVRVLRHTQMAGKQAMRAFVWCIERTHAHTRWRHFAVVLRARANWQEGWSRLPPVRTDANWQERRDPAPRIQRLFFSRNDR
jgi:hypothetical protein